MNSAEQSHPIVVFDAECVLCSANAQFVLRHDQERLFKLASIQSETGRILCRRFGVDPGAPETMLLVDGDEVLRDSDAVLAIYRRLGGPWAIAGLLRSIPRPARDALYRWVARNRYRLFGKRESCWLPDREFSDRIL